jgi:hypothetical protein
MSEVALPFNFSNLNSDPFLEEIICNLNIGYPDYTTFINELKSAKVKSIWIYISTPPYIFMV